MRLRNKPEPAHYGTPRTLTAAASTLRLNDRASVEALQNRRSNALWQDESWEYYDSIGEIKYAFGLVAAVVSRVRLYPAVVIDQHSPPVAVADAVSIERDEPDGFGISTDRGIDPRLARDARAVMEDFAANTRMAQLMTAIVLNLLVSGECYIANMPEVGPGWHVYSTSELSVSATGAITLRTSGPGSGTSATQTPIDPKTALIGRIWRPHPRYSAEADSSMRALRTDCEELVLLDSMIRTTIRSRMNAGMLFIPDALSIAARTPAVGNDPNETEPEDTFESELFAAMTQPVSDEHDASAVVPVLVRGPADLGDRIKHILLGRDVSTSLIDRAERVLNRILQGLEVPKEIVVGLADVKYSNALVITDGMFRSTIEPMAIVISDALTEIILRPMLQAHGWSAREVARMTIWYDPSEVVSKPDPAESATAGFDRFLLSGDAWRQAHGFSDADAPNGIEMARRVALEKTQVTPELAQVLMEKLFPNLLKQERETNIAEDGGFPSELSVALDQTNTDMGAPAEPGAAAVTGEDMSAPGEVANSVEQAQEVPL